MEVITTGNRSTVVRPNWGAEVWLWGAEIWLWSAEIVPQFVARTTQVDQQRFVLLERWSRMSATENNFFFTFSQFVAFIKCIKSKKVHLFSSPPGWIISFLRKTWKRKLLFPFLKMPFSLKRTTQCEGFFLTKEKLGGNFIPLIESLFERSSFNPLYLELFKTKIHINHMLQLVQGPLYSQNECRYENIKPQISFVYWWISWFYTS